LALLGHLKRRYFLSGRGQALRNNTYRAKSMNQVPPIFLLHNVSVSVLPTTGKLPILVTCELSDKSMGLKHESEPIEEYESIVFGGRTIDFPLYVLFICGGQGARRAANGGRRQETLTDNWQKQCER
jgi:hypothetical protein